MLFLPHLQDQIPPFDSAAAFAVIQAELGRPAAAVFSTISPEPVAAASLGQVYRAVRSMHGIQGTSMAAIWQACGRRRRYRAACARRTAQCGCRRCSER